MWRSQRVGKWRQPRLGATWTHLLACSPPPKSPPDTATRSAISGSSAARACCPASSCRAEVPSLRRSRRRALHPRRPEPERTASAVASAYHCEQRPPLLESRLMRGSLRLRHHEHCPAATRAAREI